MLGGIRGLHLRPERYDPALRGVEQQTEDRRLAAGRNECWKR